ncbi:hypothetical protein N234_00090 [Ralstonia pickettii DTP0602]|nr:hypothetical protein N234_00090 [Ralstonia pickettii DTP0602]
MSLTVNDFSRHPMGHDLCVMRWVYAALNLPLINELSWPPVWPQIDTYLALAGLPERTTPIAAERAMTRVLR